MGGLPVIKGEGREPRPLPWVDKRNEQEPGSYIERLRDEISTQLAHLRKLPHQAERAGG